jgi:hypothetical protein
MWLDIVRIFLTEIFIASIKAEILLSEIKRQMSVYFHKNVINIYFVRLSFLFCKFNSTSLSRLFSAFRTKKILQS